VPSDAIDTLSTPVIRAIADHLLPYPPQRLGVAVSGGSDSMALLHALHALSLDHGFDLHAVTVDHGLRAEAPAEAAMVADACAALGVSHDILRWSGPDATGNLQHQARNARYDLMAEWSDMRQLGVIALGHTQDDQAETVLLRLARGAGVDGLSAMRPRRTDRGVTWLRPLLNVRRERLRAFLTELDVAWVDDPTNQDLKYDRIKARQALAALEPLGIHVSQLAQVASNMASARDALCWQTFLNSREITQVEVGAVVFDWKGFRLLPDEIARRLLVQALVWIGQTEYPPRGQALSALLAALRSDQGGTLNGCIARRFGPVLWVFREYDAVATETSVPGTPWDGRWIVTGPETSASDIEVRALGDEGLLQCPDWKLRAVPFDVLRSVPAVWQGQTLLAAPLVHPASEWRAELIDGDEGYFAALLSH